MCFVRFNQHCWVHCVGPGSRGKTLNQISNWFGIRVSVPCRLHDLHDWHDITQRAKLSAYEALLLLALQCGCPAAVAHLARGALALLDAHPRLVPEAELAATRGRFWSNVFLCTLDQGDYEVRSIFILFYFFKW